LTLAAASGSFSLFSLFTASRLVHKFGERKSITIGACCYIIWVAGSIMPLIYNSQSELFHTIIYFEFILTGTILGFGASLLWIG